MILQILIPSSQMVFCKTYGVKVLSSQMGDETGYEAEPYHTKSQFFWVKNLRSLIARKPVSAFLWTKKFDVRESPKTVPNM
jgi:hypothetical protein